MAIDAIPQHATSRHGFIGRNEAQTAFHLCKCEGLDGRERCGLMIIGNIPLGSSFLLGSQDSALLVSYLWSNTGSFGSKVVDCFI